MMALVGMLAYEFQVTLPVVAQHVFHGGAETYGADDGVAWASVRWSAVW